VGYNPNISRLEVGEITHLQTIDPNFLGHLSIRIHGISNKTCKLGDPKEPTWVGGPMEVIGSRHDR